MNLKTILEEFITSFKLVDVLIEIWVNPTHKELKSSMKECGDVRFAANSKTKKLYVFTPEIIHNDFFVRMGFGEDADEKTGDWFTGVYDKSGGIYSDFMEHMVPQKGKKPIVKKILKRNWKWVDEYLPGFNEWYEENKKEWKKEI